MTWVAIILTLLAAVGAWALTGAWIAGVIAAALVIWIMGWLAEHKARQRKNQVAQDIHDRLTR
jgi:Flp pilus assembly protein TadB